jgi:hypothetical protein
VEGSLAAALRVFGPTALGRRLTRGRVEDQPAIARASEVEEACEVERDTFRRVDARLDLIRGSGNQPETEW